MIFLNSGFCGYLGVWPFGFLKFYFGAKRLEFFTVVTCGETV